MKTTRSVNFLFILFGGLGLAASGCTFNASIGKNAANEPAAPSANAKPASAANAAPAAAPAVAADIAGSYTITGSNESGGGNYDGDLTVTKRGDVYQFSWLSGGQGSDGVGVQTDSTVAVAFTEGDNGKGCGVVLYKIGSDGSLDGKAGYWGENKSERERATRKTGTDLDGTYDITGSNPAGESYKGTLAVKKSGLGYQFDWDAGSVSSGFGIRTGDKVAVGFGGKNCSFVTYEIKPDGSLDGKWGGKGSTSVGTEVAKKK